MTITLLSSLTIAKGEIVARRLRRYVALVATAVAKKRGKRLDASTKPKRVVASKGSATGSPATRKTLSRKSAPGRAAPTQETAAKPLTRKRRSPEAAHALILHAAQRLLAHVGPDAVGLKDVAREAGVSHALVTHYFGTIDALVDVALEAHANEQRAGLIERILARPEDGPREWMQHYFDWVSRPITARLLAWALVTGRTKRDDFFSRRHRGAKRVVDAVLARAEAAGPTSFSRADLEFVILLLLAAPHGYALGKTAFWASLGKDDIGEAEDSFFFDRLAALVEKTLSLSSKRR